MLKTTKNSSFSGWIQSLNMPVEFALTEPFELMCALARERERERTSYLTDHCCFPTRSLLREAQTWEQSEGNWCIVLVTMVVVTSVDSCCIFSPLALLRVFFSSFFFINSSESECIVRIYVFKSVQALFSPSNTVPVNQSKLVICKSFCKKPCIASWQRRGDTRADFHVRIHCRSF